jgi:hypothetical protein
MFIRTTLTICIFAISMSSCARQPSLARNIVDSKSKLLLPLVQKTDFQDNITWDIERIEQSYEIPSADNHRLVESSYRGLIGSTDNEQLIIVKHKINKYESAADSNETISLSPQEGEHLINVSFPKVGENMQSKCYSDSSLISCEVVVQYTIFISRLRVQLPQEFLKDHRITFIDSLLLNIDTRIAQIK